MGKDWTIRHIPFGKRPKKLPTVLSDEEACKLIEAVKFPKHRTVLLTCCAAGLRLSEATHLRVPDIDGQRKQLHIRSGKGRKARLVPASPRLLQSLREYWKTERPKGYLFPGRTPDVPMHSATIQRACKMAVAYAQITKPDVTPHTLRHTWATGMLEAGIYGLGYLNSADSRLLTPLGRLVTSARRNDEYEHVTIRAIARRNLRKLAPVEAAKFANTPAFQEYRTAVEHWIATSTAQNQRPATN